jgi:hypothetical protein
MHRVTKSVGPVITGDIFMSQKECPDRSKISHYVTREDGQRLQAQVDPDLGVHASFGAVGQHLLDHQGHVPVAARLLFESRTFGDTLERPVNDRRDTTDLGSDDGLLNKRNPLWNAEARRIGLLGLKFGEPLALLALANTAKEVLESAFQIAQRLLKQLAIDLAQPSGLRLVLEEGQLFAEAIEAERLASRSIVLLFAGKRSIPNEPARPGKLLE